MATYYHGNGNSEIQGGGNDGFQTLILMNPGYIGYSDTHQPPGSNLVFLNSNNPGNSLNLPQTAAPPPMQTQQLVGIPLATTNSAASPTAVSSQEHQQHDISALHGFIPRVRYNLYNLMADPTAAREVTGTQQGLSLSLSPQQTLYGSFKSEREVPSQPAVTTVSPTGNGDDLRGSGGSSSSVSGISNGVNSMRNVLLSSKYLKAAQELLDEVVSVGKGLKCAGVESIKGTNVQRKNSEGSSMTPAAAAGDGQAGRETGLKRGAELSTAERQEIQMKKAKLVNMLDEVEQRYRQYHHQMQIVISWFEQAAAIGSAKTYTALALQTISKQFRCLKDAILAQIRAASKSLGEEDSFNGKVEGSRLKFVDSQLRQQRALQHLGMIQQNAWRPQRGLPERAVSVLRAWLFEHFLHPYPKDSDKIMLAKQTGLTRSQVSNWFINARVRLWKPMVEEMYSEEMKEQEKNGSEDKATKDSQINNEDSTSKATHSQEKGPGLDSQSKFFMSKQDNDINNQNIVPPISTSPSEIDIQIQNHSGFNLITSKNMDAMITHATPKKPRSSEMLCSPSGAPSINIDAKANTVNENNDQMASKFRNERQNRDGFTLMGTPTNFVGGFGPYPTMGELGRFDTEQFPHGSYSGNGVSLTLGLPHCENLPISANYQTFLPSQSMKLGRGVEIEENDFNNINTPTSTHSTNVFDNIDIQNRKRFAAQLLPDFVAL